MPDLRAHYYCQAPRCDWTYAEPLFKETVEDYAATERILTEHMNSHGFIFRAVMRYRVRQFRRRLAVRGDGEQT